MDWFLYAIASAVTFTMYALFIRIVLKDRGDPKSFAMSMNGIVGLILLLIAPFTQWYFNLSLIDAGLVLLASLLFAFSSALLVTGRKLEEASKVSIVRQLTLIWVFTGGVMLFSEDFGMLKLVGIASILGGNILALWEKDQLTLSKGIKFVLLTTLSVSVISLISKRIVEDSLSPALFAGTMNSLAAGWLAIYLGNPIQRFKTEIQEHTYKLPLVSLLVGMSFFFVMKAYQLGQVSRVYPVRSISVILVVMTGIFFLNEKSNITKKIIGSIIAFAGIVMLRFF